MSNFEDFAKPGSRALDLTGQRFGKLVALSVHSRSRNGQFRWTCRCDCGNEKDILSTHLVGGKIKSCGCAIPRGTEHKQWTGHGEISGQFWSSILRNASGSKGRRAIPMTLTIEQAWAQFEKQNARCAYSGLPLVMGKRWNEARTASLDRIDSGEGYHVGNVQWVHKDVNAMKGRLSEERFLALCRAIAETRA